MQKFLFSTICQQYMRRAVKDPALRARLTPDYEVGCKRIVISNTIIPALQRDNVDLVTDGIAAITETLGEYGVTSIKRFPWPPARQPRRRTANGSWRRIGVAQVDGVDFAEQFGGDRRPRRRQRFLKLGER